MKKLLIAFCFASLQTLAQSPPQFSLVKNIHPDLNYNDLVSCNGKVYFWAADTFGMEIWVTDGTEAGTQITRDIHKGNAYHQNKPVVFNGKVYFTHVGPDTGSEVYATDGTYGGTKVVADIGPGPVGCNPWELTELNGKLYFNAYTQEKGRELWVTDGTAAGTSMVKELLPGANFQGPGDIRVGLGKLFFRTGFDNGLYVSDGTSAGTFKINAPEGYNLDFTEFNGQVYFRGGDLDQGCELWVTDGTNAGTKLFKEILPGRPGGLVGRGNLVVAGGKLFFRAFEGGAYYGLWLTDGTGPGTIKVHPDVKLDDDDVLHVYNNRVYVSSELGELWVSDGTTAGTKILNSEVLNPDNFYEFYGKLYFVAASNDINRAAYGRQLWQTDGTEVGTTMLLPNPLPSVFPAGPVASVDFANIGSDMFLVANYRGQGYELWKMSLFPAGINDNAASSTQYIYPNPTAGTISIQLPVAKDASVKIYSLTGQLMLQQNITAKNIIIDVSMLSPGLYLTHITTDGHTTVEKLVKQ